MGFGEGLEAFLPPSVGVAAIEGADAAFGDGEIFIKNEIGVDFLFGAHAGAGGAGAFGGVEGEKAGGEFGDVLFGMEFAGVTFGEGEDGVGGGGAEVVADGGGIVGDFLDLDDSLSDVESLLNGVVDASGEFG